MKTNTMFPKRTYQNNSANENKKELDLFLVISEKYIEVVKEEKGFEIIKKNPNIYNLKYAPLSKFYLINLEDEILMVG